MCRSQSSSASQIFYTKAASTILHSTKFTYHVSFEVFYSPHTYIWRSTFYIERRYCVAFVNLHGPKFNYEIFEVLHSTMFTCMQRSKFSTTQKKVLQNPRLQINTSKTRMRSPIHKITSRHSRTAAIQYGGQYSTVE